MVGTNNFLSELIGCFADRDGVLVLSRGDANVLMREEGYTAREADCVFASWWPKLSNVEPHTIEEAREILAQRRGVN